MNGYNYQHNQLVNETVNAVAEIPNPCQPNPCQNNGGCTPISDTEFTCDCPPGFTGDTCEQGIAMLSIDL